MRAEQKNETRRKLIEAALSLSAKKGFASLSIREVSKEAGITAAAFYRHFHDLEELGLVLIDEIGLSLRQLLRESRRVTNKEGSAIKLSVEAFINYIIDNANLFRLLQGERQGSTLAFRQALYAELGRFIEEMSVDLERVQKQLKQPLKDPDLAAEAIVSVVFTIGSEVLDLPKHKRSAVIERIIKLVKIIIRGSIDKKKKQTK